MNDTWIVLLTYAAIMFGIIILLTEKEVERFCVGNRNIGWFKSALSIAATWIWAPALFISTENAYTKGFADMTIIDGFPRYTVFGPEWKFVPRFTDEEWIKIGYDTQRKTLYERSEGQVAIVTVSQLEESRYIYGTVTHNRARGTHLLEPMKAIVKRFMNEGKTINEIGKQLGMKPEEVFRLSDFSKEDFLCLMTKDYEGYSNAEFITKI